MGIGIEQYRMRVGRFAFALKYKPALSLFKVFCIYLIVYSGNKVESLALIAFLCLIVSIDLESGQNHGKDIHLSLLNFDSDLFTVFSNHYY